MKLTHYRLESCLADPLTMHVDGNAFVLDTSRLVRALAKLRRRID